MKTYLLVFDDGSDPSLDLQTYLGRLDENAEIYSMDGHVCFINTNLDAGALSDAFLPLAGSSLFFVTAVERSNFSGRMVGRFWEFLKSEPSVANAA